jgi:hypothetical protein
MYSRYLATTGQENLQQNLARYPRGYWPRSDIPFLLSTRRSPYGRARASGQRLPVSLAVASILQSRILVLYSLQRFWMLTTYSLTTPTSISGQPPGRLPRVPRSISFSSFPFGLLTIPVTDRLPKLQSFRGKRITATSSLSVRASWLVSDHYTIIPKICSFPHTRPPSECLAWSVLLDGHSSTHPAFIPTPIQWLGCGASATQAKREKINATPSPKHSDNPSRPSANHGDSLPLNADGDRLPENGGNQE